MERTLGGLDLLSSTDICLWEGDLIILTPGSLHPYLQELEYFQFPPSINFDKIKNIFLVLCKFVQKSLGKSFSLTLRALIQLFTKQLWDGLQTVVLSPKIKLSTLSLSHICLNVLIHLPFFPLKIFIYPGTGKGLLFL